MGNERLRGIGNEIASLWGGSCYGYEIEKEERKVTFLCIEHGERFITELSFSELLQEHHFDVATEIKE